MLKLTELLARVDRLGALADHQNKYYHKVGYNSSRTIIRYILKDVELTAYAYNPGNAVVIFPKKKGLIAYGCYFDSFPDAEGFASYRWTKMDMKVAIELIKEDFWEKSDYDKNIDYQDTSYRRNWEVLASGRLDYTCSRQAADQTVAEFKQEHNDNIYQMDFTILRLSSGRLRIELNRSYHSLSEFTKVALFFSKQQNEDILKISQLPKIESWQKVVGISTIDTALLDEMKVETIAKKIKDAA